MPTPVLPATALYAAVFAVFLIVIAFRVIFRRNAAKVALNDGGDAALGKRIRVHGNFTEYVPLALILMGLCEINGAAPWIIHAMGVVLLAGRLMHVWAIESENLPRRIAGMSATFLVLLAGAILSIVQVI